MPSSPEARALADAAAALLDGARRGEPLDRELLRPVLAGRTDALSPEELDGLAAQLRALLHLPIDIAASFVAGALSQGEGALLARMRDRQEAIAGLFSSVADGRPFPLPVRSAFGVLGPAHERALRQAVERGDFTARDATASYHDGDDVTRWIRSYNVSAETL